MFKINDEVNKFNKFIFKFKKYVDIEIIVDKKILKNIYDSSSDIDISMLNCKKKY